MISFQNFHERTIAHFHPAPLPYREPDFVSASGSAYWGADAGVFRSSDHWAGQNGCAGQASCIWSIGERLVPGAWASGYCPYREFLTRVQVAVEYRVRGPDEAIADLLHEAGGALPYPDWLASGHAQPQWVQKVFRGPTLIPAAARELFRRRPDLRHAIAASPSHIAEIRAGAASLTIGTRLSLPEDHGMY